jgi:hypothetical protein
VAIRSGGLSVDLAPELRQRIDDLLGAGRFSLIASAPTVSKSPQPKWGNKNGAGQKKQPA